LMAAVPVLVMAMLLVRPLFQALTVLLTRQVLVPPGFVGGGVVGAVGGGVGRPPPTALMMASMMPCWVTVAELRSNRPKPCWPFQPLSQ
jgi:hypothetical protein